MIFPVINALTIQLTTSCLDGKRSLKLTLLLSFGEVSNNVSHIVFPKTSLKGLLTHTSNGWHLDVQPARTSTRFVLFVAINTFSLSVLCALKAPIYHQRSFKA